MECKKCGYVRSAADSAPDGQCPACGAYYAKVARYAPTESHTVGRNSEPVAASATDLPKDTWVARIITMVLIGFAWLVLLIFALALLDKNYVLALVTLPALAVAIPSIGRSIPLKMRGGLMGVVVLGIVASGLYAKHEESRELARAALERQERREQAAQELTERLARFARERDVIIATARQDLDSRRPAAVLAVAHAWRQAEDPMLNEFADTAYRQAVSAIESGNLRVLDGYTPSDFPQFAGLSARVDAKRAATERAANIAQCRQDLKCWGDRHRVDAEMLCPRHIERRAQFAHEWTDGLFGNKFSQYRWANRTQGSITYIGDSVRFQNGFGAWQPQVYECDLNTEDKSVLSVRVRAGRL